MARTKTQQQSVSLFPFLAVLICTMGALILVLLLTTRQIREQVEQAVLAEKMAAAQPDRQDPPAAGPSGKRETAAPANVANADGTAFTDSTASAGSQTAAPQDPLSQQAPRKDPAAAKAQAERLAEIERTTQTIADAHTQLADLRNRISSAAADTEQLAAQRAALVASTAEIAATTEALEGPQDLEQQSERVAQLQQQLQARNARQSEQSEQLKALYGDLDEASATTRQAEQLLHRRESALIELRELAEKAEQAPVAGTDATLLEFTNSSGTTQHPVIIELCQAGLVFQPSGVVIRTSDLEGFTARESPLVAGILAAHNGQPSRSLMQQPYALLLVRPEGCLAFYSAQRILRGAQIHFGYELLESDRRIALKTPTWDERSEIAAAIRSAMQKRQQLYGDLVDRINELKRQTSAAGQRRLSVGPDGQLREVDERSADLLPGRFYAGGVAPPAGFQQRRDQQRRDQQRITGVPQTELPPGVHDAQLGRSADADLAAAPNGNSPQTGQLQRGENVVRLPAAGSAAATSEAGQQLDRLLAILEDRAVAESSGAGQGDATDGAAPVPQHALADNTDGHTIVNPFVDAANPAGGTGRPMEPGASQATTSPGQIPFNDQVAESRPPLASSQGGDQNGPENTAAVPAASDRSNTVPIENSTPLDWSNPVAAPTDSNSRTVAAATIPEYPSSPIDPARRGTSALLPPGAATSAAPAATTTAGGSPDMNAGAGPTGAAPVDPALAALQRFLAEAEQKKADARPNRYLVDLMTGRQSQTIRVPVEVRLQGNLLQIGELVAVDTSRMNERQLLDATLNGISTQLSAMPNGGQTAVPVVDLYVDQTADGRLPALLRGLQQLDVPTRSIQRAESPPGSFLELLKKNATLAPAAAPIDISPPPSARGRIRL